MTKRIDEWHHNHIVFLPLRFMHGNSVGKSEDHRNLSKWYPKMHDRRPMNLYFYFFVLLVDCDDLTNISIEDTKLVIITNNHDTIIFSENIRTDSHLMKTRLLRIEYISKP